jgi:anti-sigma regulatory factor (Ser/Thr protein kinase)
MDETAPSAQWTLPLRPEAVGESRRLAREALEDGVPEVPVWVVDDVVLVVSELVTNALRHGGARVTVRLELVAAGRGLWVEVRDTGLTAGSPAPEWPSRERQLGLTIVSALASLGQDLDGGGTTLRAEMTW